MNKLLSISFILVLSLGTISCAVGRRDSKINFYRGYGGYGSSLDDRYCSVVDSTPDEIEFRVGIWNRADYLYHVILNEEEECISEGWFWTRPLETDYYTFKMKPKKGFSFNPGESYSLCVGHQNPDLVYYHTNKYQCIAFFEFVLSERSL